ncbi:phage tail protein [Micromonospora harpali]|jgi:phage tail-like protein|uniref:Phage tail protein n=3 Tax=Micromonospora TaxID=1873 RepID=A0ABW1HRM1_9ACTN|nr:MULTISPECIES: phage tail protein [Micromonospora]MDI5940794.1 phage tail protein [Micromonospora sp. DH15]KIR64181.1 phage tail protein [Micromonospora haikouensis]MBB5830176.1 phage tail-like protein [Micromonospora carbonacea]MDG4815969.1 phage tail protein [Micromonospora sp. WMMD956]OON33508.1 phage tail protein [Micromonospora sp. Rc5]
MASGDTLIVHSFQVELGGIQVELVQEVSGLTVELDSIEVKSVTATGELIIRKIPGARKAGEVTITRGLDKSSAFTDWIKETFLKGAVEAARQNISIILNNADKSETRRFDLSNAWVSKWEGPGLKAGDPTAATEKVTVVYEEISAQ